MPDYFYQIKGKQEEEDSVFGRWAWPPIFSGKVEAKDRPEAKKLIEEEYGRSFPTRVLAKDLATADYLLNLKEIKSTDHHTRRLFEPQTCKQCGQTFTVMEKYAVNHAWGGFDYCCDQCATAARAENNQTWGNETWRDSPPVIYQILHKPTGQSYIGKTRQAFTLRWYQHFFQGTETKFHKAIRDTLITDWCFQVVEVVEIPKDIKYDLAAVDAYLGKREAEWIIGMNSIRNGFNTQGPAVMNPTGDLFNQEEAAC